MNTFALLVILAFSAGVLSSMRDEAVRQGDLHEKEVLLQEIETVAKYCDSKSRRVDYEKGDLVCNSKKEAQTKITIEIQENDLEAKMKVLEKVAVRVTAVSSTLNFLH